MVEMVGMATIKLQNNALFESIEIDLERHFIKFNPHNYEDIGENKNNKDQFNLVLEEFTKGHSDPENEDTFINWGTNKARTSDWLYFPKSIFKNSMQKIFEDLEAKSLVNKEDTIRLRKSAGIKNLQRY